MQKVLVKVCLGCFESFETRHENRKCCSRSCARRLEWRSRERSPISNAPSGYLWHAVPDDHPHGRRLHARGSTKSIMMHRYVMEQVLGRYLDPRERVHHKDGDRKNNSPENLELWKLGTKDPAGVRAVDYHCHGCRCPGLAP